MVRESLEPGARHAHLGTTAKNENFVQKNGLFFHWRAVTGGYSDGAKPASISLASLRLPIVLRPTRRGDTITSRYSTDQGQSLRAAGAPLTFDPPLAKTVYVGLAITARSASRVSEAKFRDLRIERR